MNKQEAIEKIKDLYNFVMEDGPFEVDLINKNQVLDIVSQINEPQKVVVPKFVAEWVKWCKNSGWHLQKVLSRLDDDEEIGDWAYDENDDLIPEKAETFARAWLDGYEVEKEKLYTIDIGGVGSSRLFKHIRNNKYRFHCGKELEGYTDKLTEQEIKKADERLWEFAKPVEDK